MVIKEKMRLSEWSKNGFQRNLTSGFISRRPKEKLKITAIETAHKF